MSPRPRPLGHRRAIPDHGQDGVISLFGYLIPVVPPVVTTDSVQQLPIVRLWFAYRSKPVANQSLGW
jgi:hypothetical protein